jgi:hypothetical protein
MACLPLAGCATAKKLVAKPVPPVPSFHSEPADGTVAMRRIAVLPLSSEIPLGASLGQIDSALNEELTKTALFEVVPVSREALETRFGRKQFSSVEVLPGELLVKLRAEYGVDGVLFTDLTHYNPYRPLAIGVRAKLVDIQSGKVRWAFDHLFDTGNPDTAKAAQCYFTDNTRANYPVPADGAAILQSPARFSKYVAWEAFRSLLNTTPIPN